MSFDFLIPVATYPDPTSKDGLRRALNLAAKITGRVTAIVHEVDIAPVHSLLAEAVLDVSGMTAEAEARSRERGSDVASWLEERAGRLDLDVTIRKTRCRPEAIADLLVHASRTYDLTLLALDPRSGPQRDLAESIIFGSGGPVLVVAAQEAFLPVADQVMTAMSVFLAWDGSRAAARALRDAMPVLALAATVSVLTVDDDKPIDAASIAAVLEFLAHHGIHSRHVGRSRGSLPVGEVLLAAAADADLLVMGAYGHNRMQEFILGGATRTVLANARMPILMSH